MTAYQRIRCSTVSARRLEEAIGTLGDLTTEDLEVLDRAVRDEIAHANAGECVIAGDVAEQLEHYLAAEPDATPAQIREAIAEYLERDTDEVPR